MNSHIPGPWEAHTETGSPPFVTQEGSTSGWICQTVAWCGMDVAKANARLIAAAPDLLQALDDIANGRLNVTDAMLTSRESMMSALANYCQERARAAIAKATTSAPGSPVARDQSNGQSLSKDS